MVPARVWYPSILRHDTSTHYRVSFRIAEEGTWDHRVHDLDGNELDPTALRITARDFRAIQTICDSVVGLPLPAFTAAKKEVRAA